TDPEYVQRIKINKMRQLKRIKNNPKELRKFRLHNKLYMRNLRKINPGIFSSINKKRYRQNREAAIEFYSGGTNKCLCCGESNFLFLTIDHIEGGGRKHLERTPDIGQWLRSNDYTAGF